MSVLLKHRIMTSVLTCETGVRIGGSKESQEIGGTDAPILRHPITQHPYIPGSSLKGKIRSLLEQKYCPNVMKSQSNNGTEGKPCNCGICKVCIVFGCAESKNTKTISRAIFRDCVLTDSSKETLNNAHEEFGIPFSESKTEVLIDRRTSTSYGRIGPRTLERIPEGTQFKLEIVLRVFNDDKDNEYESLLEEGIKLLQNDTLGGAGTRGYGKVKIDKSPFIDAE